LRWILLLQEFDLEILDKKGTENVVADHLSRMEGIEPELVPINDDFPYERLIAQLESISAELILNESISMQQKGEVCSTKNTLPWYVDFVNYLAVGVLPPDLTYRQKKKFFHDLRNYYWDEPLLFRRGPDGIFRRCVPEEEVEEIISHCHSAPYGGNVALQRHVPKFYKLVSFGLPYGKTSIWLLKIVTVANAPATSLDATRYHKKAF
jgi:hypothetical protein